MTIVSRMLERSRRSRGCESSPANAGLAAPARRRRPTRLTLLWDAALLAVAPPGYEDETGFHYDPTPVRRN